MLPLALAPYATLLKYGLLVALVLGGFVTGCKHGTARQFDKDIKAIEAADERANAQAHQAAILAGTLHQIDADTAAREASAKVEAQRAKDATARAEQAAAKLKGELATIERDIAKAKRDPSCRKALESPVCAILH